MLGVCYYPEQWPESLWASDAERMRDLGITYVRISEFAWSRIEPEPGRIDFDWLDRIVAILGDAGLKIVLGTPTATPPKWLADRSPEILLVDAQGRRRRHGGRRHYDFSSDVYWQESERIVTLMAERYCANPHVAGWQIDNEFGCHDTTLSYSPAAEAGFRQWLEKRYGTIAALNMAWGTVFWSMEYRSFEEIEAPNLVVADAAPAHLLDFQRYASDRIAAYGRMQSEIIRSRTREQFVTTNFMNFFFEFDPFATMDAYDLATWDSYPLGQTDRMTLPEDENRIFARTGHPDVPGFGNDFYRGVGEGRFWIMEQQPGPVNWALHNPAPLPGMVRLWTWQALAQGAEVVSYFRWRQAPFAQEQMHAALNRPDNMLDCGGEEASQVARELRDVALSAPSQAPVAVVADMEMEWMTRFLPQSHEFSYKTLLWGWYSKLRSLGLDVDVVPPGRNLTDYKLVVVPSLGTVREQTLETLKTTDAVVLYGPRTGWKTEDFAIPADLAPGRLQEVLPLKVARVETLRPEMPVTVEGAVGGQVLIWREFIESDLEPLARFEDGNGALFAAGRQHYLAGWPDERLLDATIRHVADKAGLGVDDLPKGLRLQRRGGLTFALNFGPDAVDVPAPATADFLLGSRRLGPQDVAIWRAG
ncbi:beta-galactosidase [Consotaella aegiceratis]|uniref:beta-galactosidase n=1 Tax=Consotaella aegiceratis TaxID=3097961 RepID=UPI002F40F7A7